MVSDGATRAIERFVNASPAEVYRAFTIPAALRDWLCEQALVEPYDQGRFSFWWSDGTASHGRFTALVPNQQVSFRWQHEREPAPTGVQILLTPQGGGTLVVVTPGEESTGADRQETAAQQHRRWQGHLENLQSLLETGIDLRVVRRPMLGFDGAQVLTEDLVQQLGVPIHHGIVVGGVIVGMGLERAGLRQGDILTGLDGRPIADWPQVFEALSGYQAGDRVAIRYFRDGAEHDGTLEFSARPPEPEPPATAAELAATVRVMNAELCDELAAALAGLSEEAAGRRPASGAWSAKELTAHLILCERDLQSWIAGVILDVETADDLQSRPNVPGRLEALIAIYPTIPALLDAFCRSTEETAAFVAAFPDAFVARKHNYRRTAFSWMPTNMAAHCREHIEEIRAIAGGL
jgi:uncharacterized protein YndB with AHSA1/START domain